MLIAIIFISFICFDPKRWLSTGSLYKLHIIFLCVFTAVRSEQMSLLPIRWYPCCQRLQRHPGSLGSLQYRRQPVAYLLCCDISIEIDWPFFFSLHNGCFIMSEEPFAGPTLTFIRQAGAQIYRISESCVHIMRVLTAFPLVSFRQHSWLPDRAVDSAAPAPTPAAETRLVPGVPTRLDNSITVKCADKYPCSKLWQRKSLCEKLCRVPEDLLRFK